MEFKRPLSPQIIFPIESKIGLNIKRLRIDTDNPKITIKIQKVFQLQKP